MILVHVDQPWCEFSNSARVGWFFFADGPHGVPCNLAWRYPPDSKHDNGQSPVDDVHRCSFEFKAPFQTGMSPCLITGALEHEWIIFPIILGIIIIPPDELHHFSEGWRNTTNQIIIN